MPRSRIASLVLHVAFGLVAAGAAFMLLMSALMFDAPDATKSLVTWNFALSPAVYLATYVISLAWAADARKSDLSGRRALLWSLLPLVSDAFFSRPAARAGDREHRMAAIASPAIDRS